MSVLKFMLDTTYETGREMGISFCDIKGKLRPHRFCTGDEECVTIERCQGGKKLTVHTHPNDGKHEYDETVLSAQDIRSGILSHDHADCAIGMDGNAFCAYDLDKIDWWQSSGTGEKGEPVYGVYSDKGNHWNVIHQPLENYAHDIENMGKRMRGFANVQGSKTPAEYLEHFKFNPLGIHFCNLHVADGPEEPKGIDRSVPKALKKAESTLVDLFG